MSEPTPPTGQPVGLTPALRCLRAPNSSPMTYTGTNTYLLGHHEIAVIDPGPNDPAHLQAILAALSPEQRVTHILVTHAHLDHSPLAAPLAEQTGAPVLAFGPATAGRSALMQAFAESGELGGGEGVDEAFSPDICLQDGATIESGEWQITALHTPGHMANHMCFAWGRELFSGDHVMGWASSLVSPPDGDLTAFMASCARLQEMSWTRFYPGHGSPVEEPHPRLNWLISHRREREAQILETLTNGPPATAETLAREIYHDLASALLPAATRNVLAHLIALTQNGKITAQPALTATAHFRPTQK